MSEPQVISASRPARSLAQQVSSGQANNRLRLPAGDARKIIEERLQWIPGLQMIEQTLHRHTSAAKHRHPTQSRRIAFNKAVQRCNHGSSGFMSFTQCHAIRRIPSVALISQRGRGLGAVWQSDTVPSVAWSLPDGQANSSSSPAFLFNQSRIASATISLCV